MLGESGWADWVRVGEGGVPYSITTLGLRCVPLAEHRHG